MRDRQCIRGNKATVSQLFTAYRNHLEARKAPSLRHVRSVLSKIEAELGSDRPAQEITARDIVPILSQGYADGSRSEAAWTRALLRTVWNWAIKSPLDYRNPNAVDLGITSNPLSTIPADSVTLNRARERYFRIDELPRYVAFLERYRRHPASAVLHLTLLTGARIEEIADLRVGDFDPATGTLLLRATKTGNDHHLGLGDWAQTILGSWIKGKTAGQPIFPATRSPGQPISHNSIFVFFKRSGLQGACPRDSRRTFKTLAQVAGVSRRTLDLIQNHAEGSTVGTRHYDRFSTTDAATSQMKDALIQWEAWLSSLGSAKLAA